MFDTDLDDSLALTEREIERALVGHEEELLPLAEMPTRGWLGVELEMATPDPSSLLDADLVDAIVGFERLTGWAQRGRLRCWPNSHGGVRVMAATL